jgi:hypothetical protein
MQPAVSLLSSSRTLRSDPVAQHRYRNDSFALAGDAVCRFNVDFRINVADKPHKKLGIDLRLGQYNSRFVAVVGKCKAVIRTRRCCHSWHFSWQFG